MSILYHTWGSSEAEQLEPALELQSGSLISIPSKLLAGCVLGSPEFNSSFTLVKLSTQVKFGFLTIQYNTTQ